MVRAFLVLWGLCPAIALRGCHVPYCQILRCHMRSDSHVVHQVFVGSFLPGLLGCYVISRPSTHCGPMGLTPKMSPLGRNWTATKLRLVLHILDARFNHTRESSARKYCFLSLNEAVSTRQPCFPRGLFLTSSTASNSLTI